VQVEVVVHDGEPARVDGEDLHPFPKPSDDPVLAISAFIAAEPGTA